MQARFMTRTNIVWIISICLKNEVKILKVSPVLQRIAIYGWEQDYVFKINRCFGSSLTWNQTGSFKLWEYECNSFHMLPI